MSEDKVIYPKEFTSTGKREDPSMFINYRAFLDDIHTHPLIEPFIRRYGYDYPNYKVVWETGEDGKISGLRVTMSDE